MTEYNRTRRQWIYQIREELRTANPDVWLSNRMIMAELDQLLTLQIRRDSDTRLIYKQTNLFTRQSIPMMPISEHQSRSRQTLPAIYHGRNNPFLQLQDNQGHIITLGSPYRSRQQSLLYGWLEDDYLYVNRYLTESVDARFWARPHTTTLCQSALDVIYKVPDHLEHDLIKTVVSQLLVAPLQIPEDTYLNENSNQKIGPSSAAQPQRA